MYMTFEPDEGGFNNIRMAYETVLALAHAMGRTLVLPPEQQMYLLQQDAQKRVFGFQDFFPMHQIASEMSGLKVITMEEFIQREGITGKLKDKNGNVLFPPLNITDWNGKTTAVYEQLNPWLRKVSWIPDWNPEECMVAFPATPARRDAHALQSTYEILQRNGMPVPEVFIGRPTSVYASAAERMAESNKGRTRLCVYDDFFQNQSIIHFPGKQGLGARLLVHFYGFLFFADWKQDLWTKRFIRDHVRYIDEIQCAAARIVQAVRKRARSRDFKAIDPQGEYDAFHVRRGEFQYKRTRVSAHELYEMSKNEIVDGTTVYVATDERDKAFFHDLAQHYDVVFLDDYMHLMHNVNPNFYGMIDQLVASRSRIFFGCWFSTFTSYINRIRGYHADREKLDGFAKGAIDSYYYALPEHKYKMLEYWPLTGAFHSREFPISWRNIDHGIEELLNESFGIV